MKTVMISNLQLLPDNLAEYLLPFHHLVLLLAIFSNNNVVGALKIKHSVPTGNICVVPRAAPYTSVKPRLVSILGRVFGSSRDDSHTARMSKR